MTRYMMQISASEAIEYSRLYSQRGVIHIPTHALPSDAACTV
jgi:hypothetical protein